MRILVLSFYFRPDLAAGSFRTSALVDELLKILPEHASIDVITTLPNRYRSFSVEAQADERCGPLSVKRIALPQHSSGMVDQSLAFASFAAGAYRAVRGARYDLVFATSSRLMTAVLGARIASICEARLFLDIRDIFVDTIGDVLRSRLSGVVLFALSILERYAMRRADQVNLVSEGFVEYFRQRYPSLPTSLYTNGIDPEFLTPISPAHDINASGRILDVLYAGNIGEGQGLHEIIPLLATRMAGKLRFRVIGDGGRRDELARAIAQHGCVNVELLPPIGRALLVDAYREADVLFLHLNDLPAFEKVLPSKIFEYAATGKPVWAGVAGHAARFIRENVENSAVFSPCDAGQAEVEFDKLRFGVTPREDFRRRFSRTNISRAMAAEILRIAEGLPSAN